MELNLNYIHAIIVFISTTSLKCILRHLQYHILIIVDFLVLISNHIQQNVSEQTLCIILEGMYDSLKGTSAEITLQLETNRQG